MNGYIINGVKNILKHKLIMLIFLMFVLFIVAAESYEFNNFDGQEDTLILDSNSIQTFTLFNNVTIYNATLSLYGYSNNLTINSSVSGYYANPSSYTNISNAFDNDWSTYLIRFGSGYGNIYFNRTMLIPNNNTIIYFKAKGEHHGFLYEFKCINITNQSQIFYDATGLIPTTNITTVLPSSCYDVGGNYTVQFVVTLSQSSTLYETDLYSIQSNITDLNITIGNTSVFYKSGLFEGSNLTVIDTSYLNDYISSNITIPFTFTANEWSNLEINISLITSDNFFVTFYDEKTKNIINDTTIHLEMFSSSYAVNLSTANGTLSTHLFYSGEYTLRFYADGYHERFWNYILLDQDSANLSLYMLRTNYSSVIDITIYDQYINLLPDATVYLYRYNLPTNSYILIAQKDTDFQGKASIDVEPNEEFYRFSIGYNNKIRKTTKGAYLNETEYEFIINTFDEVLKNYYDFQDISYADVVFNTETDNFKFYYTDNNLGIIDQVCLKVYYYTNETEVLYNQNCETSQSATILVNALNISGRTYIGKAYISVDGNQRIVSSYTFSFAENELDFGMLGLVLLLIFTLLFLYIGINRSLSAAIVSTSLPQLVFSFLKITPQIPMHYSLGLFVGCLLLAGIVQKR